MNQYEAKLEARRDRLLDAADKAQREANARYTRAKQMASVIPFGQPMLADHHSYKRDRNYREKIHGNFGKAFAAQDRAAELRAKAAGVGTAGISSEDPQAADKIAAKVAELEASQQRMKSANAAIRKHAKAGHAVQLAALVALGFSEEVATKLLTPDRVHGVGFPGYQLTNNNANIRRLKARVAQVKAIQAADGAREQIGTVEYREEDCRVWLVFPGKPDAATRSELRGHGFKWSPTRGAWVRQLSDAARYHGREIAKRVGGAA